MLNCLYSCSSGTVVGRDVSEGSAVVDVSRKSGSAEVFTVVFRKSKELITVALMEVMVSPSNPDDKFPLRLFDISSMWKLKLRASICVRGE